MRVFNFILVFIIFSLGVNAQINFTQSELTFDSSANVDSGVTSLMYGPDGRLYVAEYPGAIKILTVQRNVATDYLVTDVEELDGIQTMADHNDDGTSHISVARETTGLTVTGTAQNPVIYVTSSDIRIGAGEGGGNGDVGLDTNSGVITRFSWNGSSWDVVDLVRGLSRSEENHATNGLEFVTIGGNDYLIVASGGHTNAGSPSTNFVYICEYALSGAVLSVDLTALEALPILDDNGRSYIYDLPTLDDPTRANENGISDPGVIGYDGIDVNDPFGGNDGLNQAIIIPGSPVQIFSPGYRNAYDLVVTQSGALYVTDNGANGGWGGFPVNEGGGAATNAYDPAEPGSTSSSGGEQTNNNDHLQLVTLNIQNYSFGSLYGGHPNPTRANPTGAGLYTDNGTNQVFRTLIYDPSSPGLGFTDNPNIALPANWDTVVPGANPVEGDWRGPGISNPDGADDNPVTIWGTNTNGIDEYTASNFGGVMQGNLLAGVHNGIIRRVELDDNGDLDQLTSNFLSGIGGNALGITCNSDSEIFPGTIWTGTLNGKIVVFEPQDFVSCLDPSDPSYDPLADYDLDGYYNEDEEQNGSDHCNGGSSPINDFDKSSGGTLVSDLNDTDDDFDGIPDGSDPFQLGDHTQTGSDAFTLPVSNDLFNDQQGLGGIFGLGMTGLMNNGDTDANWLGWIDDRDNGPNPNDVLGGAPGIMTSHMTSGTALGAVNTQEKGYQYGVQVDNSTGVFTVTGGMNGFLGPLRLFGNTQGVTNGELGIFIGDGTQSNYIKFVVTTNGFSALQEIDDLPQTPITFTFPAGNPPISGILFHFVVNSSTGQVDLEYQINGGTRMVLGTMTVQGSILSALQDPSVDLAVGFIGTSGSVGLELEGSWDYLNVAQEEPYAVLALPDIVRQTNSANESLDLDGYFGDNGGAANLVYTVQSNSNPNIGASISANQLLLAFTSDPAIATITVRATDQNNLFIEQTFQVEVRSELYRINTGGPDITYNGDVFSADANFIGGKTFENTSATVSTLFQTERSADPPTFEYAFSVPSGDYEVVLYFAEIYFGATGGGSGGIGDRVFDVEGEGVKLLDDYDIYADVGTQTEVSKTFLVSVSDGELNLLFDAEGSDGVDQPKVAAIAIIGLTQYPAISVDSIVDQNNLVDDVISTLGVTASGGNPSANFNYSISGQPEGVVIDPITGVISGIISSNALIGGTNNDGQFQVTATVSKLGSTQEIINFNWTVSGPPLPFSLEAVENQQNSIGSNVNLTAIATGGDTSQPIVYSISGQPLGLNIDASSGEIGGTIDSTALIGGENFDGIHQTIVTASRLGSIDIQVNFTWVINQIYNWVDKEEDGNYEGKGESAFIQAGNKFYVLGGLESQTIYEYDYVSNIWANLGDAPLKFNHFQPVELYGYIWVVGAMVTTTFPDGNPTDDLWLFDPVAKNWIQGPEVPLGRKRGSVGTVVYNDKIYMAGGTTNGHNGGYVSWFDEYDPKTGIWTVLPDAPRARDHFYAVVADHKMYLIGGRWSGGTGGFQTPELPEVDVFDFVTGQWTTLPTDLNIPTTRAGAPVAFFDNKIMVMGGEVTGTDVYGEIITDAIKITEGFDISTQSWSRLPDMVYPRHGTNAIVSGNGVYLASGAIGWGDAPPQKNMEYFGEDNPTGTAFVASELSVPSVISTANGENFLFTIDISNGNTGILISSMDITGTGAADFTISSGEISNTLLVNDSSHNIEISSNSINSVSNAVLTINYGSSSSVDIVLTNTSIFNPGNQSNLIGENLSLQLQVVDSGIDYLYSAENLPEGLSIDESTGLISGTVTGAILSSPYTSRVAIVDILTSLEVSFVNFQWEVIDPTIITLEDIPDQSNFMGDTVLFSASASGGDTNEPFVFSMSGEPEGLLINISTGEINGIIDATALAGGSNSDGVHSVTVTASRLGSADVITNFTWTITNVPLALFRINAGGPELTYNSEMFLADANFIGGKTFENISATVSPLFQTERSADLPLTFEYAFSVPSGDYEVVLHFAELFYGATGGGSGGIGDRIFDVDGEGIKLLDDYDIYADVGPETEVSKTFLVSVADGELNLIFDAEGSDGADQPKVSAIEIFSLTQYPGISVDSIVDQNNVVDDVISTLGVTASGGNPSANFTYAISGEPDGIFIEPTNGLIYGTISLAAVIGGPGENGEHQVVVTVSKPSSTPVDINFNWIITGPQLPFTLDAIVDQQGIVGGAVSLLANATGGDIVQPIAFSISGQPLGLDIDVVTGQITGIIDATAATGGANNDGIHQVTVTADRQGSTSVQEQFLWTVTNISCTWNDLADANVNRFQSRNEIVGDKIYVMGGWLDGIESSDALDVYDITNGTWSLGANLPEPLTHMGSVAVGDEIWLLGGFLGDFNETLTLTDKVRIYNTLTNSWSDGPDLPKAIGSASATVNNNKIHFIGGLEADIQTDIADHYVLDLDNIAAGWSAAAPMIRPRNHHSIESINGIIYIIGGQEGHVSHQRTNYLESYDPSNDSWTILANLPINRSHFESGSLVHNDKIIIVGGLQEISTVSNDVTEYNPSTNVWTDFCNLPNNRVAPVAQAHDDKLIVSGGGLDGTDVLINTTQWLQLIPGTDDFMLNELAHQLNQTGVDIGSIQVEASGGNPTFDFSYNISGQPNGITIDSSSGEISGIVDSSALIGGPNSDGLHFVTVTVSKLGSNDEQFIFTWNITDLVWHVKGEVENYTERHECAFVHTGDKFALIGGRESSDVDVFDYNLGVWNSAVSSSPDVLNHFQGVYYQGYVWVIGAFVGDTFPNDPIANHVWLFDTTSNQWIQGPEIPEARKRGSTGLVMYNDKFYLIGGNTLGHNGGFVPWFDEYNPETGIWTTLTDAPNARDHFQATLVGDKIYVIGGAQTSQPTSNYVAEVDVYDFTSGTWSTLNNKDLPTPRDGASIAVFNNDIVVMGGGDKDDTVNGVFVKGTREITEAFDIQTESWYKMPDMNFGHRATQAIVSGNGIHILAGQQSSEDTAHANMEYYGEDNPTGSPIIASQLSVPNLVTVASEGNSDFNIEILNGGTGIFITSMEIIGTDASDFSITSGEIANGLLNSGSSHTLNIALSGIGDSRTASLFINYGNSQTAIVNLTNSPLTNPGDQSSFIGDIVSLQIEVIDNGGAYSFTASNLPEGLVIDESTGLISGTVTGVILNSPYNSRVAIVDILTSLEVSFVNFQWEVIDPTIIILQDIPEQTNSVGDTVLFSASAAGGDEAFPMIYAISGEPQGVLINGTTGEITGNIDLLAGSGGPNNDGVYLITVTASRQGALDVITNFTWTITDVPVVLFRINAGGPELTYNSEIFSADDNFIGGKIFENTSATVSSLFQTERSADPPTFEYAFSVPSGDYEVVLYFAELYFGATGGGSGGIGDRIFDVEGEGFKLLDDYDIYADVGPQTEVSKTFLVSVSDGELNLIFDAEGSDGADQPKVSAIEISGLTQYPAISVDIIVDQNNVVDNVISTLEVLASGGNPSTNFTYAISGEPDGIFIQPTNGLIYGTISPTAVIGGPGGNGTHQVVVTVSKPGSVDTTQQFNWFITSSSANFWFNKNEDETYTARHECSFVQAGDKFYLLGGRENAQTVDIYDYATDTWNSLVNSAPIEFNHFQAVEYQGLIWVIGAFKSNNYPFEIPADYIWAFNPATQVWIQGPEIPPSRKRGSAGLVVYNNKFYILGGNTVGHDGGYVNWFDEYDPATGTWTELSDSPRPRDHFEAVVINGKLYAASGRLSGGNGGVFSPVIPEVDVYDFATENWSTLPSSQNIPTPRAGAIVANFENKLIVAGGESLASTNALAITEIFDPISQSWSVGAPLNHQRQGVQGIVSGNGIFVVGGSPNRGGGNQKNMEFYGQDNPVGSASIGSILSTDTYVSFAIGETKTISVTNSGGNIGTLLNNITLTGTHASEFTIDSGNIPFKLIAANATHDIIISYTGNTYEKNATLTITYNNSQTVVVNLAAVSDLPWVENFEDLANGSILDTGITSWSTSIDQGTWSVQDGLLLLSSVNGGSIAVWSSEPIAISGHENVTISIDVNDLDAKKESSDYVNVYYKLDDGALIPFGTVTGNISLTTFTVSGITGSVLEIVVETKVSWSNETYSIDNVNVSGTPTNPILVSSVTISPSTITVEMGDSSQQLTATVNPFNADDTSVSWLSSDDSIATVNQSGFVTPIAVGNVTITVTTTDGGFQAESIVTVIEPVIIPVTGITLNPSDATMSIGGDTLLIEATISPSNASSQSVLWSTSNNSVASVSSSGLVTANTVGSAVIIATTVDGDFTSTTTIDVIEAPTDLPWVEDFQGLANGSTSDTGDTAWSTTINQGTWSVQSGILLLSSVSGGSTAFWNSEPIAISGHENITISIDVNDLDNNKESNDYVNAYYKLDDGALIPFGTVTGNIDLITFTVSGIVGSVLELFVETKVSWSDETYNIDNVNISGTPTNPIAVSSVTISPSVMTVEMGDSSQQLTATVNPFSANNTSVFWLSSDESIAIVDQSGFVTPIAIGNTSIIVTTIDGGFQDTSTVSVIAAAIIPVTGITLSPSDATLNIGSDTLLLEATVLPSNASNQSVLWSTSDSSVVNVNSSGEVVANTLGAAVITATTVDGDFVATSAINVLAATIDLPWVEDFEDLVDGSILDTGVTAWSTSIDQGVWDVQGGLLLLSSVSGGSTAVWNSEPIAITGHENVTISIDVDDLDATKESNDYVDAYYKLDDGSLIPFGTVTGNTDLTTLTVSSITGSVLELVVETKVSWPGETYSIDNVNVSSVIGQQAKIRQPIKTSISNFQVNATDYIIYPNPTSGVLNINTSENNIIDFIQIFDAAGRLVRTYDKSKFNTVSSNIRITLDGLQTGFYSLQIIDYQKNRFVKKLLMK